MVGVLRKTQQRRSRNRILDRAARENLFAFAAEALVGNCE
jgi:hypothetical protein